MTDDLKPCPFCGGEPRYGPDTMIATTVVCTKCGARGPLAKLPYTNPRALSMLEIEAGQKIFAEGGWNKRDG